MKNDNFAASISASSVPPAATVPSDDEVDAAPTLRDLRAQEGAIMRATREHEDALNKLQTLYKRVRAKMYRDHKSAVIAEDNSALMRFQAGCPKPKEVASKAEQAAGHCCLPEWCASPQPAYGYAARDARNERARRDEERHGEADAQLGLEGVDTEAIERTEQRKVEAQHLQCASHGHVPVC